MDEPINIMKNYIHKVESTASHTTQNYINSIVQQFDEPMALQIKHAFYSGYAYGWNDQSVRLCCAGRYPMDDIEEDTED